MTSARLRAAGVVGVMLVLSACGSESWNDAAEESGSVRATVVSAADRVPSDEVADWVSYADAVVVVTITEEIELRPTQEEIDRGEGLVPRDVIARVDEVVWVHPAASPPPATFRYAALGWAWNGGQKSPMVLEGGEREEVDRRYLMAVTDFDGVLAPLGSGGLIPIDDAGVTAQPKANVEVASGLVEVELAALTTEEIGAKLESTAPDPVAEANRHLSAEDRYLVVVQTWQTTPPSSAEDFAD